MFNVIHLLTQKTMRIGQSLRTVHKRYEKSKNVKKTTKKSVHDDSFNKGKGDVEQQKKNLWRQIFFVFLLLLFNIFQGITSMKAFNMSMKLGTLHIYY